MKTYQKIFDVTANVMIMGALAFTLGTSVLTLGLILRYLVSSPKNVSQHTNVSAIVQSDPPGKIQEESDLVVAHNFDRATIEEIVNNTNPSPNYDFLIQQMSMASLFPNENFDKVLEDYRGVGLMISPKGYFITSAHLIRDFVDYERSTYAIFSRDKKFRGKVIAYSFSKDYALLQAMSLSRDPPLEEQLRGFKPIRISDQTKGLTYIIKRLDTTDQLKAENIDLIPCERGITLNESQQIKKAYTFVGAVKHGDSGTPLYDSSGAVFGIMISIGSENDNKNQTYVSPLKEFLEELIKK